MTRRSQLEKFEARRGKIRKDEDVIKQSQIENSTVEKVGEKIAQKHGVSTEDIFAVITRESLQPFVQIWNNSMESVVRETIKTEMEGMREIFQAELIAAYRGIIKGMMPEVTSQINITELIREQVADTIAPEPAYTPELVTKKPKRNKPKKTYVKLTETEFQFALKEAIIDAVDSGIDPTVGVHFKKAADRNNGLYQRFGKQNKGIPNAWKDFVQATIEANEREQNGGGMTDEAPEF